jgi:hypothetical protein
LKVERLEARQTDVETRLELLRDRIVVLTEELIALRDKVAEGQERQAQLLGSIRQEQAEM